MLLFRINDHNYPNGNIEMTVSEIKNGHEKPLVILFDNTAVTLLLEVHKTYCIGKFKEHLIDLIRNATEKDKNL